MKNEKTFDCVEMKHQGAALVQERLSRMTREEQLAYWRERGRELEELRARVIARQKAS